MNLNVKVTCEGKEYSIGEYVFANYVSGWTKVQFDLSDFVAKDINFRIRLNVNGPDGYSHVYTSGGDFTKIYVGEKAQTDLAIELVNNPTEIGQEETFEVRSTISNLGESTVIAEDYTVSLLLDGVEIASAPGVENILPDTTIDYVQTCTLPASTPYGYYKLQTKINCAKDEDLQNNLSQSHDLIISGKTLPVTLLSGSYEGQGSVQLEWEVPEYDKSRTSSEIFEDFESSEYTPWTTQDFGPWTLRNYNDSPIEIPVPLDIPVENTPGFALYNNENAWDPMVIGITYAGHDDSKRSVGVLPNSEGANDAWLISPELEGEAQTISFWASSWNSNYGTFRVYYSLGGIEKEDFIEIRSISGVGLLIDTIDPETGEVSIEILAGSSWGEEYPDAQFAVGDWMKAIVDLPEGTKHFAIQVTSYKRHLFQIDDITYRAASPYRDLEILGYNLYRDGVKLNSEPLQSTAYEDKSIEAGRTYTYAVTVVYNDGVSPTSNHVEIETEVSGLESVAYQSAITVKDRQIIVENAESVVISTLDGIILNKVSKQDRVTTPVSPGVYIVKTNDRTAKVLVK
ncbi:MAG: choice-of-anchor J domain-containing protein [Bacteroidales bacterium]|nr:choice-of-anchor J domain-containing protein [Bacteroidales bacterium]